MDFVPGATHLLVSTKGATSLVLDDELASRVAVLESEDGQRTTGLFGPALRSLDPLGVKSPKGLLEEPRRRLSMD
jgi:hypothetical protein